MNKRKIIFWIFLVFLLCIFNIKVFFGWFIFIQAKHYFNKWNYELSLNNYKKLDNIFNSNFTKSYLWDNYYKLWEQNNKETKKIDFYKKSILEYEKSLSLKENIIIRNNYNFVKSLLLSLNEDSWANNNSENEEENESEKYIDEFLEDLESSDSTLLDINSDKNTSWYLKDYSNKITW